MKLDFTMSAITCAADIHETAIESFEMAKEVVKVSFQPMYLPPKRPAENIEVDYDGDDNTIMTGWTDMGLDSVVVVAQPSMTKTTTTTRRRHRDDSILGYISPSSSSGDDSMWSSPSSAGGGGGGGVIKSKYSLKSTGSQSSRSTSTRGRSRYREYM
jgi:hypothetical protein